MKKLILLSTTLLFILIANAQIVNIPDTNFKAALVNHSPIIDTNGDGEIQVSEAVAYTGTIEVTHQNISDITGIEAFTALTELDCWSNELTCLDVSNNIALTHLSCFWNQIDTLNVNNNTQLISLNCRENNIGTLDVSNNTALSFLDCALNPLYALDVSNNTALTTLWCFSNQLNTLDVSNNPALIELVCNNNQLTSLDLSNSTALYYLNCSTNQLNSLNVKNGNNINFMDFYADGNPSLYCIEVDDPIWSTANWTNIDSIASFSADCSNSIGELQKTELKVYPNPTTGKIRIKAEEIEKIEVMDIAGKTLTGFETLSGLQEINLSQEPKGIYIIKVTTKKGVMVEKIVLE